MPLLTEATTVPDTALPIAYKATVLILYSDDWGRDEWVTQMFATREDARIWVEERRQSSEHEFPRPARISPVYSAS